jgi:hypothetical protein
MLGARYSLKNSTYQEIWKLGDDQAKGKGLPRVESPEFLPFFKDISSGDEEWLDLGYDSGCAIGDCFHRQSSFIVVPAR